MTFPNASESFKQSNPAIFTQAALQNDAQVKSVRKMNRLEDEYALYLESLKQKGEISWYGFESVTLRLADGCRYTPDFTVHTGTLVRPIRFIEVKGNHIWDDSKVKFKVAKERFWWAEFAMLQKKKGEWKQIL